MNHLEAVESAHLRDDIPDFRPGDTVRVDVRVVEAGRERTRQRRPDLLSDGENPDS